MATKQTQHESELDLEQEIETALSRTEQFLEKNGKTLLAVLAAAVILVGGYFGYKYLVQEPRQAKASDAMFAAEQMFAAGEFDTALNGDGNNAGFMAVVDEFGSTPQGRLAAHYAGICLLKAGDLDQALSYLAMYKAVDGATNTTINAQNLGLQGDVYVNKGEYAKAVSMFSKAVAEADNSLVTPYYLKKLGLANVALGDKKAALEAYNKIANQFGSSIEARDIDKYIGEIAE